MNSFISPFKSWTVALLLLLAIEACVYKVSNASPMDRTNFLQFSFAREETPQRLFVFDKLKAFADSEPTILQSGDSSGFYGIDPREVMKHLPAGERYLNMSCCANLGFRGYYNIFRFMAKRNKSIRYFVLHISPETLPRPTLWDGDGAALWADPDVKVFGGAIDTEFMSPWRIFQIPSLAYRRQVTDYFYTVDGFFGAPDRPMLSNDAYINFTKTFKDTLGWAPENDARLGVPTGECDLQDKGFFDFRKMHRKTYFEEVLDAYAALSKHYGVTLVVVFQPIACTAGPQSAEVEEVLDRFKKTHPEVEVPFPLIETWSSDRFSVPAHVRHEHTQLINDRLGKAMAEIVERHEH